jgi:pSer/pThr/pTyr-binding forkhead associated (FHA) protein
VPVAVVFLLRAVVLVLLWGFVIATVVALRHDVFSDRPRTTPPKKKRPAPAPAAKVAAPVAAAAAGTTTTTTTPTRRSRTKSSSATPTALTVVEGPLAGTTIALSSLPITIGRADDSTIVLADDYVSNHHARLVPNGSDWMIEDNRSTNGTFLGNTRVSAPTVVPVGAQIRIGRNVLELRS